MKIFVTAKPGNNENLIEKIDEENFIIKVKEPPIEGRANRAITRLLADYFSLPLSNVSIISGKTSRNKIIEIIF